MTDSRPGKIHDEEPDTSEATVRSLLEDQCPEWAASPLAALHNSGTSNAMWRIDQGPETDLVVRLPRSEGAAASMETEQQLLPLLAATDLAAALQLPAVRHRGSPSPVFPHHWSVLEWIEGADAWHERKTMDASSAELAQDLAQVVQLIAAQEDMPVEERRPGQRGGPLAALLEALEMWLSNPVWSAGEFLDVAAVRRCADELAEVADSSPQRCFVHGDLIPGNLLMRDGRLAAVIDWGGAGIADPAQDLAPAWSVLDARGRRAFREAVDVDDATWLRAKAFELEHAVGGVVYYVPRRHPLGDVMSRTLTRILTDT